MATITEDYVSFEVAKLLKEKGFPLPSTNFEDWAFCMYDENGGIHWGCYHPDWYARVTHQMAMKWLREVHKIHIVIGWLTNAKLFFTQIYDMNSGYPKRNPHEYTSYEEAVEESLKYCLENLI